MRTLNIRLVAVAALAALTFAACSSSSKPASPDTTPTNAASPDVTTTTAPTATSGASGAKTTVALADSTFGKIMVDSTGLTLYVDEKDKPGTPSCTGGCLEIWPPLAAPASATYGTGLTASMFSTVTAADGTKQLAVNGSPLYTFKGKAAGDVSGQDVGGFYVVGADGKQHES